MKHHEISPLLTTARMAEKFGRSEHAIRQMAARGQLPFRKLGRRLIFLESEIASLIERLPGKRVGRN